MLILNSPLFLFLAFWCLFPSLSLFLFLPVFGLVFLYIINYFDACWCLIKKHHFLPIELSEICAYSNFNIGIDWEHVGENWKFSITLDILDAHFHVTEWEKVHSCTKQFLLFSTNINSQDSTSHSLPCLNICKS